MFSKSVEKTFVILERHSTTTVLVRIIPYFKIGSGPVTTSQVCTRSEVVLKGSAELFLHVFNLTLTSL